MLFVIVLACAYTVLMFVYIAKSVTDVKDMLQNNLCQNSIIKHSS